MAEGFLHSFDSNLIVCSAGTNPASSVSSKAIRVMKEAGIDISTNKPKAVEIFTDEEWDYVITVCDDANETCPLFTGKVKNRLHIGFEDPAKAAGSDDFVLSEFRRIRDEIRNKFLSFYNNKLK